MQEGRSIFTGIADGKPARSDSQSPVGFSLETGTGTWGAVSGDCPAAWCFDFCHLPDPTKKGKLINLVNTVPDSIIMPKRHCLAPFRAIP